MVFGRAVGNREGEKREQPVMHQCQHLHQCVTELGGKGYGGLLKILGRETCLGRPLCICVHVCVYVYINI